MGNAILAFATGAGWIVVNPRSVLFVSIGIALIVLGGERAHVTQSGQPLSSRQALEDRSENIRQVLRAVIIEAMISPLERAIAA